MNSLGQVSHNEIEPGVLNTHIDRNMFCGNYSVDSRKLHINILLFTLLSESDESSKELLPFYW